MFGAPVLFFGIAAWGRRWTADDGFIHLRVVDQILHGNGPVFNAGERVEASTSPAWTWILAACSWVAGGIELEWIAALLGIAFACLGVLLAELGAMHLLRRSIERGTPVPFGILVVVSLPPFWDFATSGLETGLGFAWLGACFYGLARQAADVEEAGEDQPGGVRRGLSVAIGTGVLVRPDFGVFVVGFLAALCLNTATRRARMWTLAWALALPVAYQIFRMGYYAALTPNTAIAKSAARANWSQGGRYLRDLIDPYLLWIPLVGVVVAAWQSRGAGRARAVRIVTTATIAGAVVHALYITRLGGDFMHGRMLLPALFALMMPVAVIVPAQRRAWLPIVIVGLWGIICSASMRVPYDTVGTEGIADERAVYVASAGRPNPVTLADYGSGLAAPPVHDDSGVVHRWVAEGRAVRVIAKAGARVLFIGQTAFAREESSAVPAIVVVDRFNIGMFGFAAGPDVFVVDRLGLADPIAGRLTSLPGGRIGHDKMLDDAWILARFGQISQPSPLDAQATDRVSAAARALRCDALRDLLNHVEGGISVPDFFSNVLASVRLQLLEVPSDPSVAEGRFCGR
ncbi:MAG: arabinofuranosyltransferase [Acidimicrobiaceae bacterium]